MLIIAAGVLLYTALHSGLLHHWTVQKVAQKASESLNTPVHINNFQVSVSKGTIDLYGVTAEGTNPNVATGAATLPPLLQVQHIEVAAPLGAILTGKMTVNNIVIDHPVVHLIVTQDGQTNLPNMASSSSSGGTNLFQAGIRHLVLNNGEIYVNDRKDTLDADLHDLAVEANHNVGDGGQYAGTLSYANGHINYDHYAPIPHALAAKFEAATVRHDPERREADQREFAGDAERVARKLQQPGDPCEIRGDAGPGRDAHASRRTIPCPLEPWW